MEAAWTECLPCASPTGCHTLHAAGTGMAVQPAAVDSQAVQGLLAASKLASFGWGREARRVLRRAFALQRGECVTSFRRPGGAWGILHTVHQVRSE